MPQVSTPGQLADHLFRREAGKMIAMLTNAYGAQHLQMAEDVVQDTLMQACISWQQEIPPNPAAWLYRCAKNKAIDALRKGSFAQHHDFSDGSSHHLSVENEVMEDGLNEALIADDMLRMMYACCHPAISPEGAVALILKTLCGFSTAEIARAFLTKEDTISKRLYRAKEIFRQEQLPLSLSSVATLQLRRDSVLQAIYLLFNEGYKATHHEDLIREDLMDEAMRLCGLLLAHPQAASAPAQALMALLCFQASRNGSRLTEEGAIILLSEQDRRGWDTGLIDEGRRHLNAAATGDVVSAYHLQAAIAWEHCSAASFEATDWARILQCYDWLMAVAPAPFTALNGVVAVLYAQGAVAATEAIHSIGGGERMEQHYLYHAVLGECHASGGRLAEAAECFRKAAELTASPAERMLLKRKTSALFA